MNNILMTTYKREIIPGVLEFDLEFKSGLTVICGDSATGKTYFCSFLKEEDNSNKNMIFLDFTANPKVLDYVLSKEINNTIIVIDNADIVLKDSKYRTYVRKDTSNQYILMMRNFRGIVRGPQSVARMMKKGNKIVLNYTFFDGINAQ